MKKSRNILALGIFLLCTASFCLLYVYSAFASGSISINSWKIGQGETNSSTFITNNETSCYVNATTSFSPPEHYDYIYWLVSMSHGFNYFLSGNGTSYGGSSNGSTHGNGRNGAMNATISVFVVYQGQEILNDTKVITQDTIDQIRQEYVDHTNITIPIRSKFASASGGLNYGDYTYAIIQPITDQLTHWDSHYAYEVTHTSGYRNPEHNEDVPGAWGSQHQFGTAIDAAVHNHTGTGYKDNSDAMLLAATNAGADYIQGYPSGYTHVHADWHNDY